MVIQYDSTWASKRGKKCVAEVSWQRVAAAALLARPIAECVENANCPLSDPSHGRKLFERGNIARPDCGVLIPKHVDFKKALTHSL